MSLQEDSILAPNLRKGEIRMERHEIQQILEDHDDQTELLTDLLFEVIYATEVGDFSGLESIIQDFYEFAEIRESQMEPEVTKDYFEENEDL